MRISKLSGMAAVGAIALGMAGEQALAGSKLYLDFYPAYPRYRTYYPGPVIIPRPRYYYYYQPHTLYDEDYDYEPDYYEPEYVPPPRKAKKPKRSASKPAEKASKPAVTKKKTNTAAAKGISCVKASQIVASYGFAGVKARSCEGKEYAFSATRDGKPYMIRLSAANGELTQVKKQ
jgi:hypothetical protein